MTENTKGKFLIATPELRDPNFCEGVVFMCDHNDQGAFGLLINRKAKFKTKPVFEGLQGQDWISNHDLYVGGPVHTNHVLILYRLTHPTKQDNCIVDNIALASSPTDLIHLHDDEKDAGHLRLFLGCAGWGKNQLEAEIDSGAWLVKPSVSDMIFSANPKRIWRQNLARIGGRYQILSRMPDEDEIQLN